MAYIVMAYIFMAYIVMAFIVMAFIVVPYIAMAYIVMAHIDGPQERFVPVTQLRDMNPLCRQLKQVTAAITI